MSVAFKPAVFVATDEAIAELSRQNPGLRFERNAQGDLIVSPAGAESSRRNAELGAQLKTWSDRHRAGVVFDSSAGFVLPDGALYSPDAAWVTRDRWERLTRTQREAFPPLCPDAVFEIASPGDRWTDLREKMRAYSANGAALGILIDPYQRVVEIWRPGAGPERIEHPASLELEGPLSGLILNLTAIFDPS